MFENLIIINNYKKLLVNTITLFVVIVFTLIPIPKQPIGKKGSTMDNNDIKERLKLKLPDYLDNRGIKLRRKFNCLNPDHDDKNPSMSYDKKRNKVHCFSCNATYDLFELIGIEYGLTSFSEQFSKACEIFNVDEIKGLANKTN
jgi:hypothetical protein